MFKNYLKIALRNILKKKGLSFLNIAGLAAGIVCCILLLLWVWDELSYDKFHEHADELYRVVSCKQKEVEHYGAVTPPILAGRLKNEFPEVINSSRLSTSGKLLFSYKDKSFYESRGILADQSFFEIFSFPFIKGNPTMAFTELRSIVISEDLALKYFGSEDPIGKIITLNKRADYKVTGVIKNVPYNSHLQFDYVRSFRLFSEFGRNLNSWTDNSFYTYVQLQKKTSPSEVNKKLKEIMYKEDPQHYLYWLQPLTRIHLSSKYAFDLEGHGNIIYIYIFSAAALFILLIACINFMNLTTAKSGSRAMEVGMRKVVGACKSDIIKQFYLECFLLSLVSLLLALLLVYLLLPVFNILSGKDLYFNPFADLRVISGLIGIVLLTGSVSGGYPALLLSSFQPIKVIKGTLKAGVKGSLFRKILVVTQFSLTIILIIGTLTIHNQLTHIKNKNLGYNKEHLLYIPLRGDLAKAYESLKNKLLNHTNIISMTTTSDFLTHIGSGTSTAKWEGKKADVHVQMQLTWVDYDYLKTFNMQMAQGRFFSKEYSSDKSAFILNESAVKAMQMNSPLDKRFSAFKKDGTIIGVIKDFHYKSLHNEIEPLILTLAPSRFGLICVRIKNSKIHATLMYLENIWKRYVPGFPFEYAFLDDRLDALYTAEQRIGTVFNYFTFLAIFIACLGLFGLSSYTAERRTKEIVMRKILGASVTGIVSLLCRDYVKMVMMANIIAWPVAYFLMNNWLQNFASRTNTGIDIFIFSGVLVLIITLLTVSVQSFKAAAVNPVESLKYE